MSSAPGAPRRAKPGSTHCAWKGTQVLVLVAGRRHELQTNRSRSVTVVEPRVPTLLHTRYAQRISCLKRDPDGVPSDRKHRVLLLLYERLNAASRLVQLSACDPAPHSAGSLDTPAATRSRSSVVISLVLTSCTQAVDRWLCRRSDSADGPRTGTAPVRSPRSYPPVARRTSRLHRFPAPGTPKQ